MHVFEWPRLQSLVLKVEVEGIDRDIAGAIAFLEELRPATLKDVLVQLQDESIHSMKDRLSGHASSGRLEQLEKALLRFSQPRVVCLVDRLRRGRDSFWTEELKWCFPLLSQRGAFTLAHTTGRCQFYHGLVTESTLITHLCRHPRRRPQ